MVSIQTEEYAEDDNFDDAARQVSSGIQLSVDDESDGPHGEVDYLHDVPVSMHAVVGAAKRSIREILQLKSGRCWNLTRLWVSPWMSW